MPPSDAYNATLTFVDSAWAVDEWARLAAGTQPQITVEELIESEEFIRKDVSAKLQCTRFIISCISYSLRSSSSLQMSVSRQNSSVLTAGLSGKSPAIPYFSVSSSLTLPEDMMTDFLNLNVFNNACYMLDLLPMGTFMPTLWYVSTAQWSHVARLTVEKFRTSSQLLTEPLEK